MAKHQKLTRDRTKSPDSKTNEETHAWTPQRKNGKHADGIPPLGGRRFPSARPDPQIPVYP